MQRTDLKEHVVGRHAELAGVEHQALNEQGEEAMTQHNKDVTHYGITFCHSTCTLAHKASVSVVQSINL